MVKTKQHVNYKHNKLSEIIPEWISLNIIDFEAWIKTGFNARNILNIANQQLQCWFANSFWLIKSVRSEAARADSVNYK